MRRYSFGGGGSGMGGGSGGGGGMLRSVHRAVRAGVGGAPQEPFSHSVNTGTIANVNSRNYKKQSTPPNNTLTLPSAAAAGGANDKSSGSNNNNNNNNNNCGSSAFSSFIYLPLSAASGASASAWKSSSSPTCSDDSEWEYVDGSEDEKARVFYEDLVFGTVPSRDEVQHAVSALQQVLGPSSIQFPNEKLEEDVCKHVADEVTRPMRIEKSISSIESEVDWTEPSMHLRNSGMPQSSGLDRVYDAFHLLQTEPSVQRMVISLSSDKAVWDAVLNNDVVKEIRGSICQVEDEVDESPVEGSDDSNPVMDILSQVFVIAKAKIMQVIDKIAKLANQVFQTPTKEEKEGIPDNLEEKLKTSILLSIVVLLIVVVTRLQSA